VVFVPPGWLPPKSPPPEVPPPVFWFGLVLVDPNNPPPPAVLVVFVFPKSAGSVGCACSGLGVGFAAPKMEFPAF